MKKKTVVVLVVVIGGLLAWYFMRKKNGGGIFQTDSLVNGNGNGANGGGATGPSVAVCNNLSGGSRNNCIKAINGGMNIPSGTDLRGQSEANIFAWMYHIKYESGWGSNLSMAKLASDAAWQRCVQAGEC